MDVCRAIYDNVARSLNVCSIPLSMYARTKGEVQNWVSNCRLRYQVQHTGPDIWIYVS